MRSRLTKLAKQFRQGMTDAERVLWSHLRAKRLNNLKFRRQQPIGNYIVDFVCFEKRLIIEVDGGHHMENEKADLKRTQWLNERGYKVIRFWNNDVLQDFSGVYKEIMKFCE